jgi:hypothetical protein
LNAGVRVWLLIVSLLAVVAVGCKRSGGDDSLPPTVTSSSTTSTTVSYAVPAVIDAAYVGRVMQALDHVYGDAVRHLAQSRTVDEPFLKYLVATHNPRIFGLAQDLWVKIQARGFAGLRDAPADPVTRIDKLLRADRDCVLIQGDRDLSPLHATDDPTNHDRYVALTPLAPNRNPDHLNPTPWTINFSGQRSDGSPPEDACVPQ